MSNTLPFSKEWEVVLYADRTFGKNDQVLVSYGQKSNSELLLLYGAAAGVHRAPPLTRSAASAA